MKDLEIVMVVCISCGYNYKEAVPTAYVPSATGKDQWSGVIDNIEKLLEKDYEEGKR